MDLEYLPYPGVAPTECDPFPDGAGNGVERREAVRHETLIPAVVSNGGRDWPASIHNFSMRGMTLRTGWADAAVGMTIVIVSSLFGNISGVIRWRRGSALGVHLLNALPIDQVARARISAPSQKKRLRPGRARLRLGAIAVQNGRRRRVEVCNISVGGALISMGMPYPPGEVVVIELPGLSPISGLVRWIGDGRCGVEWMALLPVPIAQALVRQEGLSTSWLAEVSAYHEAAHGRTVTAAVDDFMR